MGVDAGYRNTKIEEKDAEVCGRGGQGEIERSGPSALLASAVLWVNV